jgi:hypothetical protein
LHAGFFYGRQFIGAHALKDGLICRPARRFFLGLLKGAWEKW